MQRFLKMEPIRWAFNTRNWTPDKYEWMQCLSFIQKEEKERIEKFVFKKDAKSSMAGRLMLRKFASEKLGLSWSNTEFSRSEKGRPYLLNNLPGELCNVDFNVSHQGDWVVLAAEVHAKVGIDVMKVEYVGGKNVQEFFRTMRRQFTKDEWEQIRSFPHEEDQLASFYRHWCLKEGLVKALGVGIGFSLQRISFDIKTQTLDIGCITCDTHVRIDEQYNPSWDFQETKLDDMHCIAVALDWTDGQKDLNKDAPLFQRLHLEDLLERGEALTESDIKAGEDFEKKDESPQCNT